MERQKNKVVKQMKKLHEDLDNEKAKRKVEDNKCYELQERMKTLASTSTITVQEQMEAKLNEPREKLDESIKKFDDERATLVKLYKILDFWWPSRYVGYCGAPAMLQALWTLVQHCCHPCGPSPTITGFSTAPSAVTPGHRQPCSLRPLPPPVPYAATSRQPGLSAACLSTQPATCLSAQPVACLFALPALLSLPAPYGPRHRKPPCTSPATGNLPAPPPPPACGPSSPLSLRPPP
ncbi:uncharacterized protein LOC131874157 [Cryptomeria japonica]|uniref:uncharacterized protein LOC131874157 n=1 Tax=Cryptomeria japonica TaxID=3369 RepID=UPI0027DA755F|nr:uncharacterized protein LOC131874157 [Cryptomeria japonica]